MFKAEFYFKAYPIPLFVLFFAALTLHCPISAITQQISQVWD